MLKIYLNKILYNIHLANNCIAGTWQINLKFIFFVIIPLAFISFLINIGFFNLNNISTLYKEIILSSIFLIILMTIKYILYNLGVLFGLSVVLHVLLFFFIRLGILGKNLKIILNNLLDININLISIFSFFVFILLKFYFGFNVIYLDSSDYVVTTTLYNSKIEINGEILRILAENFGSAGVFVGGARIAAMLLSKHPMGLLPKVGVCGGVGTGFAIYYKTIVNPIFSSSSIGNSSASVSISPVKITLEKITPNDSNSNLRELLSKSLGLGDQNNLSYFNLNFISEYKGGKLYLYGNDNISKSKIISALDKSNPDWRDSFIHSPLDDNLILSIMDILSNNLLLNFITLYLLIMLLLLLLSNKIKKSKLLKFTLAIIIISSLLLIFIFKINDYYLLFCTPTTIFNIKFYLYSNIFFIKIFLMLWILL